MKIKFEDATAGQLRAYILAQWGVDTHPSATVKVLRGKVADLADSEVTEFELSDDDATILARDDADDAFSDEAKVKGLIAAGMSEADARAYVGIAEKAIAMASRDPNKPVYGPDTVGMYATIHIDAGNDKLGNEDVFVAVNGNRLDIPRGVDWPVPCPYIEALAHAEKLVFEMVVDAPHLPRRYVPRKVHEYPFRVVSQPYDRAEAVRVAQQSRAALARMGRRRAEVPTDVGHVAA